MTSADGWHIAKNSSCRTGLYLMISPVFSLMKMPSWSWSVYGVQTLEQERRDPPYHDVRLLRLAGSLGPPTAASPSLEQVELASWYVVRAGRRMR